MSICGEFGEHFPNYRLGERIECHHKTTAMVVINLNLVIGDGGSDRNDPAQVNWTAHGVYEPTIVASQTVRFGKFMPFMKLFTPSLLRSDTGRKGSCVYGVQYQKEGSPEQESF